jgi:hypothetical protein
MYRMSSVNNWYICLKLTHCSELLSLLCDLLQAAKNTRGKLLHVHVPKSEKRVVDWFGVTEAEMPTIMIADMTGVSCLFCTCAVQSQSSHRLRCTHSNTAVLVSQ